MKQPLENSEFRCVHAAKAALEKYIASGRDVRVIRAVKGIDRHDVWQCVFEKEKDATRELIIKEFYDMFLRYEKVPSSLPATLYITILEQLVEFKRPLSLDDGIKIIIDGLGKGPIPDLKAKAKVCYERRVKIVEPYFKHDNEWVGYSKKVVDALDKY